MLVGRSRVLPNDYSAWQVARQTTALPGENVTPRCAQSLCKSGAHEVKKSFHVMNDSYS
jgi:hypothetical protein